MNILKMKIFAFYMVLLVQLLPYTIEADPTPKSYFQSVPKVELHLHLGGAYPLDYLHTITTPEQKERLEFYLEWLSKGVDYNEAFQVFNLISQIVNTDEKVEKGTLALCRSLEADGVVYAEIRTSLKDLGHGYEGYLKAVIKGMQEGITDHFDARLLLSLKRTSTLQEAKSTIDLALKYKEQGIVGIDISGDSTLGQIETIIPELLRAKKEGLLLTLHIGESPKEEMQREVLELLQPERIGHGVFLAPDALDWVLKNHIPLEVCPSSSLLVQMIDQYSSHPGLYYYQTGHPIMICTDDPLIFSTSLSQELELLVKFTPLSIEQVSEMIKKSLNYAFLSQEEKGILKEKYQFFKE